MGICICKFSTKITSSNITQKHPLLADGGNQQLDILKKYNFVKVIGHGGFSVVRLAYVKWLGNNPKNYVAVKSIHKSSLTDENVIQQELRILKQLDHPNVINYFEVYNDANYIHIIMEYCQGGDLIDLVHKSENMCEKDIAHIIYKLISAVNYLHTIDIVHRDLKPDNILILDREDKFNIKIIDFGLSFKFDGKNQRLYSLVGTPYYIAPEVISGDYNKECDVWSIGVIIYLLLGGYPPFNGDSESQVFEKIIIGNFNFKNPVWDTVSGEAKQLIQQMLIVAPRYRITLQKALNHPWFKKFSKQNFNISEQVLSQLKNIQVPHKFAKQSLKIILKYVQSQEIQNLRDAFEAFDVNKTGFINIDQLNSALHWSGLRPAAQEIQKLVKKFANFRNGQLKYSDFILATIDRRKLLDQDIIQRAFEQFVPGNSGVLRKQDLLSILENGTTPLQEEEKEKFLAEFDQMDLKQFRELMQRQQGTFSPFQLQNESKFND